MRSFLLLAGLCLALATQPSLALAQRARSEAVPGWIGIAYEVADTEPGSGERAWVRITDVSRGSPAESAGIRVGDRLVAIDAIEGAALKDLPARLRLRPGQVVRLRLEREGRRLELALRAAERPPAPPGPNAGVRLWADSMTEAMFRAMDSLRVELLGASGADAEPGAASAGRPGGFRVAAGESRGRVGAPFEFFVFRGERYDSLVREMGALDRELERLRRLETERATQARGASRGQGAEEQNRGLAEVREAIAAASREAARLRGAMSEAARASAGVEYVLRSAAPPEPPAAPLPAAEPFRPLTPYLLGSSRVAGAHVVDLGPELGAYFGVGTGLLVVDVAPGTPAALAGLLPGDVVTRLDRVAVHTVDELRSAVAQAGDTVPLTLVRRGASLQVLLRRR